MTLRAAAQCGRLTRALQAPATTQRQHGDEKVVLFSGHMLDLPDRPSPRFPPARETTVRAQIDATLAVWRIGPGDLGICGGAQGGDILFAEACLDRQARVQLYLALPLDEFIIQSVRPGGAEWEQRLRALLDRCEVFYWHEHRGPEPEAENVFAQTNRWLLEAAEAAASPHRLYAILVWDQQDSGDGPGGTSDLARQLTHLGDHLAVIDPLADTEGMTS